MKIVKKWDRHSIFYMSNLILHQNPTREYFTLWKLAVNWGDNEHLSLFIQILISCSFSHTIKYTNKNNKQYISLLNWLNLKKIKTRVICKTFSVMINFCFMVNIIIHTGPMVTLVTTGHQYIAGLPLPLVVKMKKI